MDGCIFCDGGGEGGARKAKGLSCGLRQSRERGDWARDEPRRFAKRMGRRALGEMTVMCLLC